MHTARNTNRPPTASVMNKPVLPVPEIIQRTNRSGIEKKTDKTLLYIGVGVVVIIILFLIYKFL